MRRGVFIALKSLPIGLILLSIYVLEYLGRMRMGMMRYLVFMKREFEMGIFQPMVIQGLTVFVVILTLWVLINSHKKTSALKQSIWYYWLLNQIILTGWLVIPSVRVLKSYHFALIAWMALTAVVAIFSLFRLRKIDKASQL
jgi:hypothetical protein